MHLFAELTAAHTDPLLLRLIGLNKWALRLRDNTLHLETGKPPDPSRRVSYSMEDLSSILSKEDMQALKAHWGGIIATGTAGPDVLPFIRRDGTRVMIESVGSLHEESSGSFMLGYYRIAEADIKLQKRTKLLTEFLASLVQNSPSCILVFDSQSKVINANEALKKFLVLKDQKDLIGRQLEGLDEFPDRKFISVIRAALVSPGSCDGKHVMLNKAGEYQSIYWRCFSLSTQDETIKTRVFSFNYHPAGPLKKYA